MSGKPFAVLVIFLTGSLCLMQTSDARSSSTTIELIGLPLAEPVAQHPTESKAAPRVLLILGLREVANQLVRQSVFEEFHDMVVESVDAGDAAASHYDWPEADLLLATGKEGCRVALASLQQQRILCTLLTEESFLSLETLYPDHARLSALVIDQPVSRQARVAHSVYPSLSRFAVFSGSGTWTDEREGEDPVHYYPYDTSLPLSRQLGDALSSHDALIATPESRIYNSSTLSTVLLTAYGYRKPVIGFSRAYIKAGALITCYSTPAQILRQVAQEMNTETRPETDSPAIIYPRYFSVTNNASVAISLGLLSERSLLPGQTLTDEDFQ